MGAPPPACTVQEVQSERGGGRMPPVPLLLFWDADGLATGLQVEIDRKGGQCAFHAEAVAAFLWIVRLFHLAGLFQNGVHGFFQFLGGDLGFHRLFPLYCASSGCTCDAPKNDAR